MQLVDPGAPAAIALVIDTSNSMAGTKLTDAITAARQFADAQKNGNLLGVYGFDSTAYPAARLSPDRTEVTPRSASWAPVARPVPRCTARSSWPPRICARRRPSGG